MFLCERCYIIFLLLLVCNFFHVLFYMSHEITTIEKGKPTFRAFRGVAAGVVLVFRILDLFLQQLNRIGHLNMESSGSSTQFIFQMSWSWGNSVLMCNCTNYTLVYCYYLRLYKSMLKLKKHLLNIPCGTNVVLQLSNLTNKGVA